MSLRNGHGRGAGVPRIEVLPVDELPEGLPGHPRQELPADRGQGGRFATGNSMARYGGEAKAGMTRLAHRLGLQVLPESSAFAPYKASATSFRKAQCAELAASVGGGVCGPGPSSLIASASLQLAWSRYFYDLAALKNEPELAMSASRMADASRQNLLAAHELCAKEAHARKAAPVSPHAVLAAALDPSEGP